MLLLILLSCEKVPEIPSNIPESILEVPDPGPENNKTLAGIDSDKDGIRDDVQRWINAHYHKKPNLQKALKQFARSRQIELLSAHDKEKSIKATHKVVHDIDCIYYLIPQTKNARKVSQNVTAIILNTSKRIDTSYDISHNFHGEVTGGPLDEDMRKHCHFKIQD